MLTISWDFSFMIIFRSGDKCNFFCHLLFLSLICTAVLMDLLVM